MAINPGERGKGGVDEMALPPGVFLYMQDIGKGGMNTCVGPLSVAQQGQLRPVLYNPERREFNCDVSLDQAVRQNIFAGENDYVVLYNPVDKKAKPDAKDHPPVGDRSTDCPVLAYGRTEIIPGPVSFALWPEQHAKVIPGHRLRTNNYLVVRIIDGETAKANWSKTILKKTEAGDKAEAPLKQADIDFSTGNIIHIKGTQAKWFIPCTGVEVVPDEDGNYVLDAMTLERLEYCIPVDENGNKRYPIGPDVVFPEPTETFFQDERGNKKFRAIELNPIQGIHVKVIADYTENAPADTVVGPCERYGAKIEVIEKDGQKLYLYSTGKELFITGKDCPIYYPRAEHSVIKYRDPRDTSVSHTKHYATAVPLGAGRYVLDRLAGRFRTEIGEQMLLCNPIHEVQVRRVLTDRQTRLWFPGNSGVAEYNAKLRAESSTADQGYISEAEAQSKGLPTQMADMAQMEAAPARSMSSASVVRRAGAAVTEQFVRSTSYTPPRTVTIDTRLDGGVAIDVWRGFAVEVVSKSGKKEVVIGQNRILDYDETLTELGLSTSKPKTTDKLEETVYLCVSGNSVGDILQGLETQDHVPVEIKLSYRVQFEDSDYATTINGEEVKGDRNKWFAVRNYVKLLCDHIRSMVRGMLRRTAIRDFDAAAVDLLRDLILGKAEQGKARPGMFFLDNCMRVVEVEVLGVQIKNDAIASELQKAQFNVVKSNLVLDEARRQFELTRAQEELSQSTERVKAATATLKNELSQQQLREAMALEGLEGEQSVAAQKNVLATEQAKQAVFNATAQANLIRQKATEDQTLGYEKERHTLELESLKAAADADVARFNAAKDGVVQALVAIGDKVAAASVAQALNPMELIAQLRGEHGSFIDLVKRFLPGLEDTLKSVTTHKPGTRLPLGMKE